MIARALATSSADGATQVALVTGAAGGLGRAICRALSDAGMTVVAADIDGDGAAAIAGELSHDGADISGTALDVTSRPMVESVIGEVVERRGRLDVVVNLAGVIRNQLTVKIEDADFDLVMSTHVRGTLNTMRAALPPMRSHEYGRIVNMSSLAARGSIAGGAYGAAKGAIEGLTRSTAMECAKDGVTINCVAPGLIAAGMFLTVPEDYQQRSAARIPMGRAGTAQEVAAAVAFLASRAASYITGQTLGVCGGLSLGF